MAELLTGARDAREQREVLRVLREFDVRHPDTADSARSLELLAAYRFGHGIGWADCLIAATAMRLATPVATINDRHFAVVPGLQVVRPY